MATDYEHAQYGWGNDLILEEEMTDSKEQDLTYPEWKTIGYVEYDTDLWQKANPPINDIRKKLGYPEYDGSLEDALKIVKETDND